MLESTAPRLSGGCRRPGYAMGYAVYRTGGSTALGQHRAYIGVVALHGRSAKVAVQERWLEHKGRGPAAAR